MPAAHSFDYAVVRVVPHVEREEFINVGVLLFCRTARFLDARVEMEDRRVTAFAPDLDLPELRAHLRHLVDIARGNPDAGPVATLSLAERWHWLTSPRSTVLQLSPAHSGLCHDPEAVLARLMTATVAPQRNANGDT